MSLKSIEVSLVVDTCKIKITLSGVSCDIPSPSVKVVAGI